MKLKMQKPSKLTAGLVLNVALITFTLACLVHAAVTIYSNTVGVTVHDYAFQLSVDKTSGSPYDTYTFTGSLKLGTVPLVGQLVTLEYNKDSEGWVSTAASDTTLGDGSYSITWVPGASGNYEFRVRASV